MHVAKDKTTMNAKENMIGHDILLRNKRDRSTENFKHTCCTGPRKKWIKSTGNTLEMIQ
jgi:hypothetical protein